LLCLCVSIPRGSETTMKRATSKILIITAFCLVTVVSYGFAGTHRAGSFGSRNNPGLHKKSPNGKQHSRSTAHKAKGSKGQSSSSPGRLDTDTDTNSDANTDGDAGRLRFGLESLRSEISGGSSPGLQRSSMFSRLCIPAAYIAAVSFRKPTHQTGT
jgi:hypothetical protein